MTSASAADTSKRSVTRGLAGSAPGFSGGVSPRRAAATWRSSTRLVLMHARSVHAASVSGVATRATSRALVALSRPSLNAAASAGSSRMCRPIATRSRVCRKVRSSSASAYDSTLVCPRSV